MSSTRRPPVQNAAGAVLWRQQQEDLLVAVVHRPRYDDWSLPKGKLHAHENPLLAAVREVAEETGARVEVGRRLLPVEYELATGRKRVSYWAMRYLDGEHEVSDEVDELRWLTVAEAARLMTYPMDRGVLADFASVPWDSSLVLLVRHAKAGKRSAFKGDDRLRPLDKIGRRQARDSVPVLSTFGPQAVLSADRTRCEQTVTPLAEALALKVESRPEFSDEAYLDRPGRARRSLLDSAEHGRVVICSQGSTIPGLLADLRGRGNYPSRKGSAWALSVHAGEVVAADYYPRPQV